jgi:hypothetical protein
LPIGWILKTRKKNFGLDFFVGKIIVLDNWNFLFSSPIQKIKFENPILKFFKGSDDPTKKKIFLNQCRETESPGGTSSLLGNNQDNQDNQDNQGKNILKISCMVCIYRIYLYYQLTIKQITTMKNTVKKIANVITIGLSLFFVAYFVKACIIVLPNF